MRVRYFASVAGLGLAAAAAGATTAPSAWGSASPETSIGAAPAPGSSQLSPGGGYFAPTLSPGSTWYASLLVSNDEPGAATISVYPADGLTAVNSGAVYSDSGQPLTGAGTWVHPSSPSVTVPPGAETTVGFSVTVPASAQPGDHLAAVVAQATAPASQSSGSFQVHVLARVVTAVLIRVPGPAAFDVALGPSALETTVDRIGAVVVPISDTGRLLGKPILTVTLTQHNYRRTEVRNVDTLLPAGTAHFPVEWPDSLAGTYGIRVCASGAGLPAPVCRFNLASIAGPTVTPHQIHTGAVSAPRSNWAVIFAIISILLALVVVVLVVKLLRRRRGRVRSRARHAITGYGTRVGEFGPNGNGRNRSGRRGTTNGSHAGNGGSSSDEPMPTTKGSS